MTELVEVELNADGRGTVKIDGKELNGVTGFELIATPNALARVTLTLIAERVRIKAAADVRRLEWKPEGEDNG